MLNRNGIITARPAKEERMEFSPVCDIARFGSPL
jgi:hypothetical protein